MKATILLTSIGFLFAANLRADDAKPKAPGTEEKAADTAEALVEKINALVDGEDSEEKDGEDQDPEKWMAKVEKLMAQFRKQYPEHPLRWNVLFREANLYFAREELSIAQPAGAKKPLDIFAEILAAPDASKQIKAIASTSQLVVQIQSVNEEKMSFADWEKMLKTHFATYPDHEENAMLAEQYVQLVEDAQPEKLNAVLEELSKSPNQAIADFSGAKLATVKAMEELKSKPLDLKFKALDGSEVDIQKLRGKVVLVDFWATWCGPCMAKVTEVSQVYQDYKAKGFEIIGISLDDDEAALKKVLKQKSMTWPQYYDGTGWENPFAKKYGITSIPTMWLIDKKGMLVDAEAHDDLEEKVRKYTGE
jgi:thiol-disulfide isomerase/thioredoxin